MIKTLYVFSNCGHLNELPKSGGQTSARRVIGRLRRAGFEIVPIRRHRGELEGPMEVIDYGKYGRYYKCGDSLALANEIESFLREGVNVQQVEDAYCFAREHFDVVLTAQKYINEYKKVIC